MRYYTCAVCGEEIPEYFEACPKCNTKVESSPYQLLLPTIVEKTATHMREKYRRVPEATHVHDLTRCSTKREMEERFPQLAETVLFKPPVQMGEMVHTFIESLPTIDRAQQIFERRVNRHLVVGKPDITTEEAVYCLKYRERLYREPRVHDVLEAGIYAWLARKPYGHIIYINPREFKEWVYLPTTTENVLYLIEHPMSPRWGWECRLCPFKPVCPIRRHSSNPLDEQRQVVTPETVARWRRWRVPEEIIERATMQRRRMAIITKVEEHVTIPNYAYRMPRLPQIEAKPWGFAKSIDFEGHIDVRLRKGEDRTAKIDKWLYRYEYQRPRVTITTRTYQPIEEMANMVNVTVVIGHPYDTRLKRRAVIYTATAYGARAVRICHLIEPHLTHPEKKRRAREILTAYREHPMIRIA